METRTQRWLAIGACIALPLLCLLAAWRVEAPRARWETLRPPSCEALVRSAASDPDAAATAAGTTIAAVDATAEEVECARAVVTAIDGSESGSVPPTDCERAEALEAADATAAAAGAFTVLAGRSDADDRTCGSEGLARLDTADTPTEPDVTDPDAPDEENAETPAQPCAAVGRQAIVGSAAAARAAAIEALTTPDLAPPEADCLGRSLDALATSSPAPVAVDWPTDATCTKAAEEAARGNVGEARKLYEARIGTDPKTESPPVCAIGGLSRLPGPPTVPDRTYEVANRALMWATGGLPGGPWGIPASASTATAAVAWLLTIGLLTVAARQYVRWRRERLPGRLVITSSDDDKLGLVVRELRSRLDGAGMTPQKYARSGAHDLVVDVQAALTDAGGTGVVAKLFNSIKGLLQISTGYVLTVETEEDTEADAAARHTVTTQLDHAATEDTLSIERYPGDSPRQAAARAAYGVFVQLASQRDVARRTPLTRAWRSPQVARQHFEAVRAIGKGSLVGGLEQVEAALEAEPGNVLLHQRAFGAHVDLAHSDRDRTHHYFLALASALRSAALEERSYEAHYTVGVILSYVEKWADAWVGPVDGNLAAEDRAAASKARDDAARLLDDAAGGASPLAALKATATTATIDPQKRKEAVAAALELSVDHWKKAVRRARWWYVAWGARRLRQRWASRNEVWVWRRQRFSVQDIMRGARVATEYDLIGARSCACDVTRRRRLHLRLLLAWIRVRHGFGLVRRPDLEFQVQYNLVAAWARRAVWNNSSTKDAGRAIKALDRYFGARGGVRVTTDEIADLLVDPDLTELCTTSEFERWVRRVRPDAPTVSTSDRRERWKEAFQAMAATGLDAHHLLHAAAGEPRPPGSWWSRSAAEWATARLGILAEDLDRWTAMEAWARDPLVTARRAAVRSKVPTPLLTGAKRPGGPVTTLPVDVLGPSPDDPAWAKAKAAGRVGTVEAARTATADAVSDVETAIAARDLDTVDDLARTHLLASAAAWAALATWAQTAPPSPPPAPTTPPPAGGST